MHPEEKKKRKTSWLCVCVYLQKEEHHYKYLKCKLFYIPFLGTLSENRNQVGLSSTTHACFRRKMYQKKTICVPFSSCNFSKTWSPCDADNHSRDTVLKIAKIWAKMVDTQSGTHSPKKALILYFSQESLVEDRCL